MAELVELKKQLLRDAVAHGVENCPQPKMQQWLRQLRKAPQEPLGQGRLVNHFAVGAGSELAALGPKEFYHNSYVAAAFGFLAAESVDSFRTLLKVSPQRSCVKLVAALWRGLKVYHDAIPAEITKMCSPYVFDPTGRYQIALNGLVEFGRKGSNRVKDVEALDAVYTALAQVGVFDRELCNRRAQGDWRARRYGLMGDTRHYHWGYGYWSMPNFLESPIQALTVLTLAKLAVVSADEVSNWLMLEGSAQARLVNLLARYKGLDDDARLVYWWISKNGFPKATGKFDWSFEAPTGIRNKTMMPKSLVATDEWVNFTVNKLMGEDVQIPQERFWWKQTPAPGVDSWRSCMHPALAEAVWGLKNALKVDIGPMNDKKKTKKPVFFVSNGYQVPQAEVQRIIGGPVVIQNSPSPQIRVSLDWLSKDAHAERKLRKVLCEYYGFYDFDARKRDAVFSPPSTAKYVFKSSGQVQ